jgi:hypothetical protein
MLAWFNDGSYPVNTGKTVKWPYFHRFTDISSDLLDVPVSIAAIGQATGAEKPKPVSRARHHFLRATAMLALMLPAWQRSGSCRQAALLAGHAAHSSTLKFTHGSGILADKAWQEKTFESSNKL